MECEKCGGDCWNNTKKNEERAAEGKKPLPLWVCKDKDGCGWVKWPPKEKKGTQGKPGATPKVVRPLGPLYFKCMQIAKASLDKFAPTAQDGRTKAAPIYTAADLAAATATLLIAATNTGAPLVEAPKPKPVPVHDYQQEDPDELPPEEEDEFPF